MSKIKTEYFCQNCGNNSPKWLGKCSECGKWNTYVQEIVKKESKNLFNLDDFSEKRIAKPQLLNDIKDDFQSRIIFQDKELNRVLGGGLVHGSLILFGGEPGIGKSTLMLQTALNHKKARVLYVSGEESIKQIKLRADRIGQNSESCYILNETNLQNIFIHINEIKPHILVIDSIQTVYSSIIESTAGSVTQIRECTGELMKFAKMTQTSVFIIGHITKDGNIAGPKLLEHMVDTVLQFEGDRNFMYRLLRTTKNRFGSTNELGIYEMQKEGLIGVENPSDVLISNSQEQLSGVAISCINEGVRALLIEIQALVCQATYGVPQRTTSGFDSKRLNMLLAVLEKKCGFKLASKDVFINITGGLKINDPSIDVAICIAILSSNFDFAINNKTIFVAELGLSGEIRPVSHIESRINEAQKLGYEKIIISKYNKGLKNSAYEIEVIKFGKIEEIIKYIFKK